MASFLATMRATPALPAATAAGSRLGGLLTRLDLWIERHRQRYALLELNDALLKDIGLSRLDAVREGDKPFWRA